VRMTLFLWVALVSVRSLNAISYVLMSILAIRDYRVRKTRWGGPAYSGLIVTFAVLYLSLVVGEVVSGLTGRHPVVFFRAVETASPVIVTLLLFQAFYHNEREYLPGRKIWKAILMLLYAMGLAVAIDVVAFFLGIVSRLPIDMGPRFPGPEAFGAAGVVALLCVSRRPFNNPIERRRRRWVLALCIAWACVLVLCQMTQAPVLFLAKDICPLIFLFVVTYYVERLAFFDVLMKKGGVAFISLFLLAMYFMWVMPVMRHYPVSILVWALSAWPIVLVNPWLYQKLSAWLDRLWLGRRFTPAEASEHFRDGLQGAISEAELVGRAEQRLRAIFQSEAEVILVAGRPAGDGGDAMQAPIRLSGELGGVIRVRARAHNPRFLSEDVALLQSLAEVFSFLLENLRLREKRLEHEKRERELVLNANRSELKALRAQVNPHFLFNALNTIASLIPRHPDRAEKTIEQLAEMFRYTLRGSDREWVTLDEELEAVRAYLDVERERFGDRLAVRIASSEAARKMHIPAMAVQTLVENAVKHGAGAIRTQAVVEIEASVCSDALSIVVRDNGPGFPPAAMEGLPASNGGYGLRNVRERLQGHFGDAAGLHIDRDTALGLTAVTLRLPCAAEVRAE